jgi:HAD superfamily hydrolase (TIGR01509 family)
MQAVVFDWDGTLADTLGAIYRANVAVLAELGLPFDERLYRRHYAPDWRVMYARLGVPAEQLDEANDRWLGHLGDGAEVEAFPGTLEALRRLADAGIRLGLVTAGHREVVEPQLGHTGLGDLLPVRVFGDDLPVHKPDPRPLRLALGRLGTAIAPSEAVYVGDAPDDMRMARSVGATGIGIASILGDPEELRAAGASVVVDSVAAWVEDVLATARPAERDA